MIENDLDARLSTDLLQNKVKKKPRQKRWSTNPDRRESEREKKRAEETGRKKVKEKREQTPDSDPSSQTQSKNFVCLFPANFVFYSSGSRLFCGSFSSPVPLSLRELVN
ncbi:PREDICTED: uncharacterized protein LOC101297714 [Fragaria vesca subsp. vesca]